MKKWVYKQIRETYKEKPPAPLWQKVIVWGIIAVIVGRIAFYLLYGA